MRYLKSLHLFLAKEILFVGQLQQSDFGKLSEHQWAHLEEDGFLKMCFERPRHLVHLNFDECIFDFNFCRFKNGGLGGSGSSSSSFV